MHVKGASPQLQFKQILQIFLMQCRKAFSCCVRDVDCFTTGATTDALWSSCIEALGKKSRAILPDPKKLLAIGIGRNG